MKLTPGMIQFADPRPRNGEGQFAPEAAGGPDPLAMARAYGPAAVTIRTQPKTGALAAAGATGAGLGAGAASLARRFLKNRR